jgi:hypothetical protein
MIGFFLDAARFKILINKFSFRLTAHHVEKASRLIRARVKPFKTNLTPALQKIKHHDRARFS